MSGNTSATGGFLTPVDDTTLDGPALDDLLHDVITGISGLDPTLVRPRWQPVPPPQPVPATDWVGFGIMHRTPDANAYVRHIGSGLGSDEMQRHEELDVLLSFYGPNAQANADLTRDGLWIDQNRDMLGAAEIGLVSVGMAMIVPEIVNAAWLNRCDLPVRLRRRIRRTYAVRNIASATVDIDAETVSVTVNIEE